LKTIIALLIALMLMLTGCTWGTVYKKLDTPEFKEALKPRRDLKVVALTDGSFTNERIMQAMSEGSDLFEKQTGIRIGYVSLKKFDWNWEGSNTNRNMYRMMRYVCPQVTLSNENFDYCMLFSTHQTMDDYIRYLFYIGGVVTIEWARIEDSYRRYIRFKSPTAHNIAHEMVHGFVFKLGDGSDSCLMASGLYVAPWCHFMGENYWEELMKNKWRNFSEKPSIREDYKPDAYLE
jgi:hypothetical protein